jgi:hypothetical protein
MARPRIARSKEDIAAIPSGQPIQIELPPEGEVIVPPETASVPPQTGGQPPQQPPVQAVAAEPRPRKDDSELTTLKSQFEQLKKSSDEAIRLAQQEKAELQRQYETRNTEYQTAVSARSQAELDAIENGITAAQADIDSAVQESAMAAESASWGDHSKAQSRMARAHSRLAQLESMKMGVESRIDRQKQEAEVRQRQPQQGSGDPVEDWISRMQGVNESQKSWLRQHRELVTDNEKNARLQVAHFDAQKANKIPGSDDYFQFIEEKLGYRQVQGEDEDEEITQRPQIVSAPPTREAPSATGRTSPTRVTLTASEREIAAASGIDEITYARNKLKMMQMKQEGHYRE